MKNKAIAIIRYLIIVNLIELVDRRSNGEKAVDKYGSAQYQQQNSGFAYTQKIQIIRDDF
jgi:hypothetical protein